MIFPFGCVTIGLVLFSLYNAYHEKGVVHMKMKKIAAVASAALFLAQLGVSVSADQVGANPYTSGTTSTTSTVATATSTTTTTNQNGKSSVPASVASVNPYYPGYYYNGRYYYNGGYYYNGRYYYNGYYYDYPYGYYYDYPYSYYNGYYNGYYYDPYYYGYTYNYGLPYGYYYGDANYYSYMGFKTTSQVRRDNTKEVSKGTPYITHAKSYNGWSELTKFAKDAKSGNNLYITLNGASQIPADIIAAVKGKDVLLSFTCDNGAVWSIYGKDVREAKAIDPNIEYDINYVPKNLKKQARKGTVAAYRVGITKSYDDLGTSASITVKVGKSRAGLTAQVYLYDENKGSLVPVYKSKVKDNGLLIFDITSGGPYFITLA